MENTGILLRVGALRFYFAFLQINNSREESVGLAKT